MPKLRSLFARTATVLALMTGAGAAQAANESATFELYVSGIKAGTMSLVTDASATQYSARARIDAAGMLGTFLTFAYDGRANGALTAKGNVVPSRFQALSQSPRGDRTTRIDWKNGKPTSVSIEPPRDNAPDFSDQAGALDPISAVFAMLSDGPADSLCATTVRVFDGSRLSQLSLGQRRPAVDNGFTCDGTYARLRGEAHSMTSQREFPFQLVFSPTSDGAARLERIEAPTSFGKAVLQRRS